MAFDLSKHVIDKQQRDVVLDVAGEELVVTVRPLPWSRKRQFASLAVRWDDSGSTNFDGDFYMREVLKAIIVKAPWPATTDLFLSTIDEALGNALESLVPDATEVDTEVPSVEDVKKGS